MTRTTYERSMFRVSGVTNTVGAAGAWSTRRLLLEWLDIPYPQPSVFLHGFLALVLVFGFSYLTIARDPRGSVDLVWLGLAAKTLMVALYGTLLTVSDLHVFFLIPLLIDLVFAALYAEFLWRAWEPQ